MGRRKKTDIVENPTPMKEENMNIPVVSDETEVAEPMQVDKPVQEETPMEEKPAPVAKRLKSSSTLINVRESPNGEVLFRLNRGQKVMVEEEKDGWTKICAYVMTELIGEL